MDTPIKKILVTGSAGLVGSACVELFTNEGWEVIGVDNNGRSKMLGTPTKDVDEFDIRDEQMVNDLFQKHTFDAIIHAAGQPSHDYSTNHALEDFDINARGTLILLEATRKYCPDATFVYVSTDKVYGDNMGEPHKPYNETLGLDFAGKRSLFGCSKTAADIYVQEYGNTFGIKTGIFRPGCITGRKHEGAQLHGMFAYLIKCVKEGIPYKIFGFEGKQVRDQIHASDLANAFWHFIQNPKVAAVYNIGGGPDRAISIMQIIEWAEKKTGKKCLYEFAPQRSSDRQWDVHDVSKFRKDYPNWHYRYSLEDILEDVCAN
jgi:CDP-paratose 2-epimerase